VTRAARTRGTAIAATAVALAAILVLLIAGSRTTYVTGWSSRIPAQSAVAVLRPGREACEGPVMSPMATDAVAVWGGPVLAVARVELTLRSGSTRRVLASGRFATRATGEHIVALAARIPSGRPLTICLRADVDTFSVQGTTRPFFSAALLKRASWLSALPTAFSRASLFHPSWVGVWTFWLLAVALLASFAAAAVAVTQAAAEDDRRDQALGQPDEDRPQPVT
jgi:hypothetical protein